MITSGGHGFAAMSRRQLLRILRERARPLGVRRPIRRAPRRSALRAEVDLVVAADGSIRRVRTAGRRPFGPTFENRHCRYIWFGTDKVFDAFTFDIRPTDAGVMQVHAYPYDATGSTLIVEMTDEVWRKAGFATSPAVVTRSRCAGRLRSPTRSHDARRSSAICSDGPSGSTRQQQPVDQLHDAAVRAWHDGNVVLLGDAAHTAHFSIGSGTKLAMEDALALVACLAETPGPPGALAAYEAERKPVVVSTQRAAQASLEWFENLHQYVDQPPIQFAFNLLTRSRRVTYENLQVRDPEFVARWTLGSRRRSVSRLRPPMFHPLRCAASRWRTA